MFDTSKKYITWIWRMNCKTQFLVVVTDAVWWLFTLFQWQYETRFVEDTLCKYHLQIMFHIAIEKL